MNPFQSELSGGREIAPLLKANKLFLPEGQDRACRESVALAQTENPEKKDSLPAIGGKH